ncbi:MAG: UvrB/UvrC motif-containing protein, partial [Chitinophagaceae bacterium]
MLAFIKQNIPLRTCKLPLTEYNIQKGKFKVCLEYHLGNCKGPCAGLQTQTDYLDDLAQVKNILSGKLAPVMQHMKSAMQQHVTNMEFEKAAQIKKKIEHLEKYQVRSAVVNPKMGDVDVCSILVQEQLACVNFMMVRGGAITSSENIAFTAKLADTEKDILAFAISYFRNRFESTAAEVVTPFEIEILEAPFTIKVPKLGEKKTLLSLSEKNAAFFATEQIRKKKLLLNAHSEAAKENLLPQLQADLHLATLPTHIECFDNSNFQGSYP